MSQPKKKIIVAYGFEYDSLIGSPPKNTILCKCFENLHPFYAAANYIESTYFHIMNEKIAEIEKTNKEMLEVIDNLAKYRFLVDFTPCKPYWRTVIYYENIKFDNIGYESEGDENGDGR
jgi:hypothetical protein